MGQGERRRTVFVYLPHNMRTTTIALRSSKVVRIDYVKIYRFTICGTVGLTENSVVDRYSPVSLLVRIWIRTELGCVK